MSACESLKRLDLFLSARIEQVLVVIVTGGGRRLLMISTLALLLTLIGDSAK
jgi:hypothetical protein